MKIVAILLVVAVAAVGHAQAPKFNPPKAVPPDEKTADLIEHRTVKLRDAIKALPKGTPEHVRTDVEVYLKARWSGRHATASTTTAARPP